MGADDDLLARDVARIDQARSAGVDLARMLVAFHSEARAGQMDTQLAADLTVMYFEALLDRPEPYEDED